MGWFDRAIQALRGGSTSGPTPGRARHWNAPRRVWALEELEPRLPLAAPAPGLVEAPETYSGALNGKIVFTSGGHGWQWNTTLNRYATDRGDNNEIVEDFGNQEQMTYYADYLLRAGATVVPMRPVGRQLNEVVLDNDSAGVTYSGSWSNSTGSRYYDEDYGAVADSVSYRFASTTTGAETAVATYTPNIPQAGFYPVYTWVASSTNRTTQLYRINHTGGSTEIRVDHSKVGHGWVYLGTYHFDSGSSDQQGSVQISNNGPAGKVVIADAIRFGNGMGDYIWTASGATGISGYPREDENSYHWIARMVGQGTSLTTAIGSGTNNVSAPSNMAEWMFSGAFGEALYIGFHSNAGGGRGARGLIDSSAASPHQSDLAIYTGRQINQDMQALSGVFEYNWYTGSSHTYTSSFGEINLGAGAEMDATIIEVAFHDSVEDAALMRDPKVRDQLARSTYQATLEYFDVWGGLNSPVSLPTAPTSVRAVSNASGAVTVSWAAGPSTPASVNGAAATGYRVYASIDGYGFDGGTFVSGVGTNTATLTGFDPNLPYYFKVAAENAGGRSHASEVVTALPRGGPQQVLIVNGYDRLDRTQDFRYPYAYTGDGLVDRVWSRYNNSFDYVAQVHAAIHAAEPGAHVASTSNEAVISGAVNLADYHTVIWILGEESTADDTFNASEQTKVEQFIAGGGNLFVTGAEIAWDLDQQNNGRSFYENTLKGNYVADDANSYTVSAAAGGIFAGLPNFGFSSGSAFSNLDSQKYNVDSPDVISAQAGAQLALNYVGGAGGGAAIQVQGTGGRGNVVMFAFPFETITSAARRSDVIDRVFQFFSLTANMPAVGMETFINGQDADSAPGPTLATSGTATFTYEVTNPGNVALQNVVVTDDNGTPGNLADDFNPIMSSGDTNSNNQLDLNETWTFSAVRPVVAGQQTHLATVSGDDGMNPAVTDGDAVNYFGSAPAIHLETIVNGDDADSPPGPQLAAGSSVTFLYVVTNTGNVPLSNVAVADDNGTPGNLADDVSATFASGDALPNGMLDSFETWFFIAERTVVAGQYSGLGTAYGEDSISQGTIASDPTNYFGVMAANADWNGNGTVDAADYVLWRKYDGTSVPPGTLGDADGNGDVNSLDYDIWTEQFGSSPGSGSAAVASESAYLVPAPLRAIESSSETAAFSAADAALETIATRGSELRDFRRPLTKRFAPVAGRLADGGWQSLLVTLAQRKAATERAEEQRGLTENDAPPDDANEWSGRLAPKHERLVPWVKWADRG